MSITVESRRPQWEKAFLVDGVAGGPIKLEQVDRRWFRLGSTIEFLGRSGLDGMVPDDLIEEIRRLAPGLKTDLGSVPGPTRWFLGSYGEHTPAVIMHDWLIPTKDLDGFEGLTDAHADRYMRFMLQAVGVRWLKRWLMWSAVALRSRFASGGGRRAAMIIWLLGAIGGVGTVAHDLMDLRPGEGTAWAVAAIIPFSILWGRQIGAALIAAIAAPWLLPPTVVAAGGYLGYLAWELGLGGVRRLFGARERDPGTLAPEGL